MRELTRRILDIILAWIGIISLSFLFLLCILMIFIESGRPIFFSQERLGKNGKIFKTLKFRTMINNVEGILQTDASLFNLYKINYKIPPENNSLVTRWGKIMLKTSLDELPQFFNILQGDMSLVGPRPIVPPELSEYGPYGQKLLSVKPGLTGFWQVSGRNLVGYPERVFLDMFYIDHQSWRLDAYIIFKTFLTVIKMQGAY
jgi:exopolysaccharide production protein ExoY